MLRKIQALIIIVMLVSGNVLAEEFKDWKENNEVSSLLAIMIGKEKKWSVKARYNLKSGSDVLNKKGGKKVFGYYYEISNKILPSDDIKVAYVNFNNKGVAQLVRWDTGKENFQSLFKFLSEKYDLIERREFPEEERITFRSSDGLIILRVLDKKNIIEVMHITEAYNEIAWVAINTREQKDNFAEQHKALDRD